MHNFQASVTAVAAVANSVATSQTPAGAGNLTLTATPVTFTSAQRITITTTADLSSLTFTITGTGPNGAALTTSLAGPHNATVTSLVGFLTVSQVAISGAAAGALTVGNSATAESIMYVCDAAASPFDCAVSATITSGSPTFSIQYTYDNVLSTGYPLFTGYNLAAYNYGAATNTWFSPTALNAQTSNVDGAITYPVNAIRLIVTVAGTVQFRVNQVLTGT